MRIDANISLRPKGTEELNTKVEVKNMNSIRHVGDAIAFEIERQAAALCAGEAIVLHTRLWDPEKRLTVPMRGKFEGPCIPDPTVPPIVVSEAWKNELFARLPEMPARKAERFKAQYGLTADEAQLMSAERDLAEYFEALVGEKIAPRTATHWLATQLLPALKERGQGLAETTVTPGRLAALLAMLEKEEINANAAKAVLARLFESDQEPAAIVAAEGFRQVSDSGELVRIVEQVLAANPAAIDDYRNGIAKAIGFLIGQVMQASQGKANPKRVREILAEKLGAT